MDKFVNQLLMIAAGIFLFGAIMVFVAPTINTVSEGETTRLEAVTNGGDFAPPSAWRP